MQPSLSRSHAAARSRPFVVRLNPVTAAVAAALIAAYGATPRAACAGPTGEVLVGGHATVARPNAQTTIVTQTTPRAAIDWNGFSINANEAVVFKQPSASSVALNRVVVANNPSNIYGSLKADGQVFLINPSGILFGRGASVNVAGLVASTADLKPIDFMNGRHVFTGAPHGKKITVEDEAKIRTLDGGYVALLANRISQSGEITANKGTVALGAGRDMVLDFHGDGLLSLKVNAAAAGAKIDQTKTGIIVADGGRVIMSAAARNALLDTVLNVEGIVQARGVAIRNGEIFLDGGDSGVTRVAGTLDVSNVAGKGGDIRVLGEYVGLSGKATLDASGATGGGAVLVGGGYQGKNPDIRNARRTTVAHDASINTDATVNGDGGKVIVWADDATRFHGMISARGGREGGDGGFVETSGKHHLDIAGARVDARAPRGATGTWLLDPTNIEVVSLGANAMLGQVDEFADPDVGGPGSSKIAPAALDAGGANVVLQAQNDITFTDAVNLTTTENANFTAQAGRTINVNNTIATNGTGNITLLANNTGSFETDAAGNAVVGSDSLNRGAGAGHVNVNAAISTGRGNIKLVSSIGGDVPGNVSLNAALTTTGGSIVLSGAGVSSTVAGTVTTAAPDNSGSASGSVSANTALGGAIDLFGTIRTAGSDSTTVSGGNGGNVTLIAPGGTIAVSSINTSGGNSQNQQNAGHAGAITFSGGAEFLTSITLRGNLRAYGGNYSTGVAAGGNGGNGAAISFPAAPVVLGDHVLIETYGGASTIALPGSSGNITFSGTVDATTSGAQNLTLNAGTGNIGFNGAVGSTRLGALQINNAANVTAGSSVAATSVTQVTGTGTSTLGAIDTTGAGGISLNNNAIALTAPVSAAAGAAVVLAADTISIQPGATLATTGAVTLRTQTASRAINVGAEDGTRMSVDNDELNRVSAASITIGGAGNTGQIRTQSLVSLTAAAPNLTLINGAGGIVVDGAITAPSGGSITLNANGTNATTGGSGVIAMSQSITAPGGSVTLNALGGITTAAKGTINVSGADAVGSTGGAGGDGGTVLLTSSGSGLISLGAEITANGGKGGKGAFGLSGGPGGAGGKGGAVTITNGGGAISVGGISAVGGMGGERGGDSLPGGCCADTFAGQSGAGGAVELSAVGGITSGTGAAINVNGADGAAGAGFGFAGGVAGDGGQVLLKSSGSGTIALGAPVTADGGRGGNGSDGGFGRPGGSGGNGGKGGLVTIVNSGGAIALNGVSAVAGAQGTQGQDAECCIENIAQPSAAIPAPPAALSTVQLSATSGITQAAGTRITAANLLVLAGGNVLLPNANTVEKIAARTGGAGLHFANSGAFAVSSIPAVGELASAGIVNGVDTSGTLAAAGGEVFLHRKNFTEVTSGGNLTVNAPINAQGGPTGNGGIVTLLNDSGSLFINNGVNVSRGASSTGNDGTIQLQAAGAIDGRGGGFFVGDTNGSLLARTTDAFNAGFIDLAGCGCQLSAMATVAFETQNRVGDGYVRYIDSTALTIGTAGGVGALVPFGVVPAFSGVKTVVGSVAGPFGAPLQGEVRISAGGDVFASTPAAGTARSLTVAAPIVTTPTDDSAFDGSPVRLGATGDIVTTASITTTGPVRSGGANGGNAGDVFLRTTGSGDINVGAAITANGGAGGAGFPPFVEGDLVLPASDGGNGGNAGTISLLAGGAVVTHDISAKGGAGGAAGDATTARGQAGQDGTIQLTSGAGITQTPSTLLQAAALKVRAGSESATRSHVVLDNANQVATIAASVFGNFSYTGAGSFTVGSIPSIASLAENAALAGVMSTGDVVLTAGPGGTLTNTSGIGAAASVVLNADAMTLGAGGIATTIGGTSNAPLVTLRPVSAGRLIAIGGAVADGANTLGLSAAELATVHADTLRIGRNDVGTPAGAITVAADVAFGGDLHLITGAGIDGSAGGIGASGLAIDASGAVTLSDADNKVRTLAAWVRGANGFTIRESDGFTIGTVDGVSGLTAATTTLTVGGSVGQAAGARNAIVTGSLGASAFGGTTPTIVFENRSNQIGSIATSLLGTGSLSILNTGNMAIAGTVDAGGGIALDTTGILDQNAGAVLTTGAGAIALTAREIDLRANLNTAGGAVTLTGPVVLGADIVVNAAGGAATFDSTVDGAHALTVNAGATTAFNGAVGGGTALTSLTTNAAGTTRINGGGVTTTGAQTYNDAVVLGANTTLTGLSPVFGSTVSGNSFDLALDFSGATLIDGARFGGIRNLSSGNGDITRVVGTIVTTGSQTYGDAIVLVGDTTFAAGAGNGITFNNTVDGAFDLVANTTGTTAFNGVVGGTTLLSSLATNAGGGTRINGGAVRTAGAQSYGDAVALGANTTLSGTSAAFGAGISGNNGSFDLALDFSGITRVDGTFTGLRNLSTGNGGTTQLSGTIQTTGSQTYGDDVTLGADTVLNSGAGNVTFAGTLESPATPRALTITSGNVLRFVGAVGGNGNPLASLATAAASTAINGGAVTTVGTQTYNNPVTIGANTTLASSGGNITFGSTLDADFAAAARTLLIDAPVGTVTFSGSVGSHAAFADFDVISGPNTIVFNGSSPQTVNVNAGSGGNTATFSGNVRLDQNVTIDTGGGANNNVMFANAIETGGATNRTLAIDAGSGNIDLQAVGNATPLAMLTANGGVVSFNQNAVAQQIVIGANQALTNGTATLVSPLAFAGFDGPAALTLNGPPSGGTYGGEANMLRVDVPGLLVVTPNTSRALFSTVWLQGDPAKKPFYQWYDDAGRREVVYNSRSIATTSNNGIVDPQQTREILRQVNETPNEETSLASADAAAGAAREPAVCTAADAKGAAVLACAAPEQR